MQSAGPQIDRAPIRSLTFGLLSTCHAELVHLVPYGCGTPIFNFGEEGYVQIQILIPYRYDDLKLLNMRRSEMEAVQQQTSHAAESLSSLKECTVSEFLHE